METTSDTLREFLSKACLQNIQFQGVQTRWCEAYMDIRRTHLGADNAEIGGFGTCVKYVRN